MIALVAMENILNNKIFKTIFLILTFLSITVTGIIFKQQFIRILPLFISLFVVMLQANANRYAYIAGAINCLIYTYVYIQMGLYGQVVSTIFLSFPIQILTFLNWRKHAYKSSVIFKKMSNKTRVCISALVVVVWVGMFVLLNALNSNHAILDNTTSILGILVSILTMLAYIEYSYLWIINTFLSVFLYVQVAIDDPAQITYVIYAVYSFVCTVIAFINVTKLYKVQRKEREV